MNKVVPPGWAEALLGEITTIVSGSTPKTGVVEYWGGDISWITPDDLSKNRSKAIGVGARSLTQAGYDSCSTTVMPPGSVLYSSRAPIGYAAIATRPVCTNQGFKSFVPSRVVTSDYLYWFVTHATPEIRKLGSGTTFPELSKKSAASVVIPLPPLNEQRRIVAAIEEQFSRLDAGDISLIAALRRLDLLRLGILEEAFALDAPTVQLGSIAKVGSGATPKRGRAEYWEDGTIPWVTSGQLNQPYVGEAAEFITVQALRETNVKLWPPGTLLVALYGEGRTRGRCAELVIEATTNQACAALVLDDTLADRGYVRRFFDSSYDANRRLAAGGVQPNLSLGLIRGLRIPLPSLEVQRQIVARVEHQLSVVDALRSTIDLAKRRSATLRRSILERAFRGELVSQDPADEPTSALLERIRAEREAMPTSRRRRVNA